MKWGNISYTLTTVPEARLCSLASEEEFEATMIMPDGTRVEIEVENEEGVGHFAVEPFPEGSTIEVRQWK